MADAQQSTNLGAAHVSFTADFSHLTQGIQHAVKMAQEGARQIKAQFAEIERAGERAGKAFSGNFSIHATVTIRVIRSIVVSLDTLSRTAARTGLAIGTSLAGGIRTALATWKNLHNTFLSTMSMWRMRLVFFKLDLEFMAASLRRMMIGTAAALGGMAGAAVSFEQAFVMVRRVVDATDTEFEQLEKNVRNLSKQLPISANELADLMGVAGRLGIRGVENLTAFTEVIAKLQMTTDIVGEEAAATLARMLNVMDESTSNIDRVGASIVDLGNKFATTEMEIILMANRLARAGHVVGMTTADVLGLATALSQAGLRADAGGSAMNRVMINMAEAVANNTKELRRFASVAGMTVGDFARQFRAEPIRAIEAFVRGLRRMADEGGNVFAVIDELGLAEIRTRDAILALAGAMDKTSYAIHVANQAWEENVALNQEVEEALNTTSAQFRLLWNELVDVARQIGDQLQPVMRNLLDVARGVVSILENLTDEQKKNIAQWTVMVGVIVGVGMAFMSAVHIMLTALLTLVLLIQSLSMLTSPMFLGFMGIILILGLVKQAFKEDWGGIGSTFVAFVESVKNAFDVLNIQSVVDEIKSAIAEIRTIWSEEETLGDKLIKTGEVIVKLGKFLWEWAGETYESLLNLLLVRWGMEDKEIESMSLPEKTIEAVTLAIKEVVGLFESLLDAVLKRWGGMDEEIKNMSLPQKTIAAVSLVVGEVVDLLDSIISWWLGIAVTLTRKTVEMLGLDPDDNALVGLVEKIKGWWDDEEITLPEKVVGIAGLTITALTARQLARQLGKAITARLALLSAGVGAGLHAAGLTGLGAAMVKISLAAIGIAGIGVVFMDEQAQKDFREGLKQSLDGLKTDLDDIWTGFWDDLREAGERALKEGRLFDPLTLVVENVGDTIAAVNRALRPIMSFLMKQIEENLDVDLGEAFRRGLESGEIGIQDPRVAAFFSSLIDLGGAIGQLLMETIELGFNLLYLIAQIFSVPITGVLGTVAEVGAELAGAMTKAFQEAWDDYSKRFKNWFKDTIGTPIYEALVAIGLIRPEEEGTPSVPGSTVTSPGETRPIPVELPPPDEYDLPNLEISEDGVRLWGETLAERMASQTLRVELSDRDRELIARMVTAEAQGESREGMIAVAEVILNRLQSEHFPNTVEGVLFQPGQFEPVATGLFDTIEANTQALEAVEEALKGTKFAKGALFFFNPEEVARRNPLHWMLSDLFTPFVDIGGHRFGTETRLLGRQHGAIMPGLAGADQFLVRIAPGEAIVPSQAIRQGWPGVLAWFQSKGVPGFQHGLTPTGIPGIDNQVIPMWDAAQELRKSVETIADSIMTGLESTFSWLGGIFMSAIELLVQVLERLFPEQAAQIRDVIDKLGELWQKLWERPEQQRRVRPPVDPRPQPEPLPEPDLSWLERFKLWMDSEPRRWASAITGFVEGLETGSRALDRFIGELLRGALSPGAGWGGLINFGIGLVGQLLGGLFGGGPSLPQPREFVTPDPITDPGGLAAAIERRKELVQKVEELRKRVAHEERHTRAMDNFFDRRLGAYDRAVEALNFWRNELEKAERALEGFEVRQFLGFDPAAVARAVESGFDMADPSRLGAGLENVVRNALVRAWTASVEMLSLQEKFGEELERVMMEFIRTGELQADALDPLRATIADIETRGEAFAELLKELGISTEDVNREMGNLSRNIPRIFRVNLERFRVADVTNLPSLASEGYIKRSGLAMVHAGEIVARADRFGGGDINVTVNIHGDGWDSDRLRTAVRREVSNAVRDSLSARYGVAGVGV